MRDMAQSAAQSLSLTGPLLLTLFMAAMILPVSVELSGTRLSPVRLMVLVCFIPLMWKLLSGQVRMISADIFLAFFCLWMMVSLAVVEGTGRLPFATISAIEVMGGYLLGRVLIRNIMDFRLLVRLHLMVMVVLFPFALIEFIGGPQLWARWLDILGDVEYRPPNLTPRMGFERALSGFEHPILFGVFCSTAFALVFYTWRDRIGRALTGASFVGFMTFMSLSSGAVVSIMLQFALIVWDKISKGRWKLLIGISVFLYVFLSVASNRGPVVIFIDTLTFSQGTAWTRMVQWEYGGAEVLRNPVFGIGMTSDWQRPAWLYTSSVDAYWLVVAMRHGFPAIGALCLAIALAVWRIVAAKNLTKDAAAIRTGHLIVLTGLIFSMATVHLWDANVVYFYFFLGAGVWVAESGGVADPPGERPFRPRLNRFFGFCRHHCPRGV